jgi:putative endopeptidase
MIYGPAMARSSWAAVPIAAVVACAPERAAPVVEPAAAELRFDVAAIDRSANPCVDFYEFACGGWRRTHPIPADRSRWSRYAELAAENLERERAIVEDVARAGGGSASRAGALYRACMDEVAIAARGAAPLADVLDRIDAMHDAAEVVAVVADLHVHHVEVLFSSDVGPDPRDAHAAMLELDSGALGLGARDEYLSAADKSVQLRAAYVAYVAQVLGAIDTPDPAREATYVVALETELAAHAMSPTQERDPDATTHVMTATELAARYPGLDWARYFALLGAAGVREVNVAAPAWFDAVAATLRDVDPIALRAYFRFHVARKYAIVLPAAVADAVAQFELHTQRGVAQLPPRWKRCLELVDAMVGDDVGRSFLARYFPDAAQRRAAAMVERVRRAFADDLAALDWLSADARKAALAKLARVEVVVGGSRRMRDYAGLDVRADDAFGDTWRAREADTRWQLAQLGAPIDRERFFDTPAQDLDGFSAPHFVAIGFTAGLLQPPVFDAAIDDAVNFGGLGGVMGHELSHEFDDEGRKFDADGNLHPWWTPADIAQFETRAQCFIDEYAQFHAEEGTPLDGKLTLGENIADNGGLQLAYAALRPSSTAPARDGFTPLQRFFLAWGQIRCENVTPEAERRQVQTDGHSPGRWRVDGVVQNMPEFATAFACPAGAPMAPAKRCRLW